MNIIQRIIVLAWGVLVALKFKNIPKYVELERVKLKVSDAEGYQSMQQFNDYGSIIPTIAIYTVIAIALYLAINKLTIEFQKYSKEKFVIITAIYIIVMIEELIRNDYVWWNDYIIIPTMIYLSIGYIIALSIFYFKILLEKLNIWMKKGSS